MINPDLPSDDESSSDEPEEAPEPEVYSEEDGPPRTARDWLHWLRDTLFGR